VAILLQLHKPKSQNSNLNPDFRRFSQKLAHLGTFTLIMVFPGLFVLYKTDRQTDEKTGRQTDRQTGRQTDRHTDKIRNVAY